MTKIQLISFMLKNVVIRISGLTIPSATSIIVTIERKIRTPQIF
jgi:hypothetical protein